MEILVLGFIIYLFAILLALTNTFWLRYQLDKEKKTKKQKLYFSIVLVDLPELRKQIIDVITKIRIPGQRIIHAKPDIMKA